MDVMVFPGAGEQVSGVTHLFLGHGRRAAKPGAAGAGVGSVFIIAVGLLVLGLVVMLVVAED